jgi:hypothetical protein
MLRQELQHYAYRDISHHLSTIDRYTRLAAEQAFAEGRRTNVLAAVVHAKFAFLRNYLLRGGIRDGAAGFLISILNSYYVFLKLAKLWELQHSRLASRDSHLASRDSALRGARSEEREARGEEPVAKSEGREARGEERVAKSEGRVASSEPRR